MDSEYCDGAEPCGPEGPVAFIKSWLKGAAIGLLFVGATLAIYFFVT